MLEDADEARLIRHLAGHLGDLPAGTVCTWNGAVRDGPFLAGRTEALGLDNWFELAPDPGSSPSTSPSPVSPPSATTRSCPAPARRTTTWTWPTAGEGGRRPTMSTGRSRPWPRAVGVEVIEVDRAHMDGLSVAERMAYNLSDVVATYRLAGDPGIRARGPDSAAGGPAALAPAGDGLYPHPRNTGL